MQPVGSPSSDNRALLVHAYADGELDPVNALAVEQMLADEPAMAAEAARIVALREALARHAAPERLPAGFAGRIEDAVGSRPAGLRQPATFRRWGTLAASVLLGVALGSVATHVATRSIGQQVSSPAQTQVAAVLDHHLRALLADSPVDIASSDRHAVKPWFNGRTTESPRVVDLQDSGFPLKGARIDVVAGTPVPTLVYSRRLHLISLSALGGGGADQPATPWSPSMGYNRVTWTEDGTRYWAVSDLNQVELLEFAQRLKGTPPKP